MTETVWSRSVREEVVGVLWLILAAVAPSPFIYMPAAFMGVVSIAGSIYFAVRSAPK